MFPHTITVYHLDKADGRDRYIKTVLDGWYWNSEKALQKDNKGILSTKPTTIVSDVKNARNFGTEYEICDNDRIILGTGDDIASFKELKNAVTVKDIAVNICNSEVDNIVITGV